MKLTIYGASDDLVEIDGDLPEEFNGDEGVLAFSDGTLLKVKYDGTWVIRRWAEGTAVFSRIESEAPDSDNYTDRVTLEGEFKWVVWSESSENGLSIALPKKAAS